MEYTDCVHLYTTINYIYNMAQVHPEMEKAYELWYIQANKIVDSMPKRTHIHSSTSRTYLKCTFTICCMPCICYSFLIRVVLCPFTCGKSLGGNSCTNTSDDCITTTYNEINRVVSFTDRFPSDLIWVASEHSKQKEVKALFMKFINKFIISSLYQRYKLCDWATINLRNLGYNLEFDLTPEVVVTVINQMFRNIQD